MANSNKKSSRKTGGLDGKYIVSLLIVAALIIPVTFAVSAGGDGNLPESTEVIENSAFKQCTNLVHVTMKKVKSTGSFAFKSCINLTSVELPSTIKRVDVCAFEYNYALVKIAVEKGAQGIQSKAFIQCHFYDEDKKPIDTSSDKFPGHTYRSAGYFIYKAIR